MKISKPDIAVIIPCYNEGATIAKVIKDFQKALPLAMVYVFDNNSSDNTTEVARHTGAIVKYVKLGGKGNVVRRMFADVEADVYVMVDGDATYDAASAPLLIDKLVDESLDMVVGCRAEESKENNNFRPGHRLGNKLLTGSVQKMFNGEFTDMLSGYRAFSRRFAKSFPAESNGFEIETELTVFTLQMKLPYGEVNTPYSERPEGSESKLSTYRDGWRILKMIFRLYSNELPLRFWSIVSAILLVAGLLLATPAFVEYFQTGKVERFPSLIVGTGIALASVLSLAIGLILRTVTIGRRDAKHLVYLQMPLIHDANN